MGNENEDKLKKKIKRNGMKKKERKGKSTENE